MTVDSIGEAIQTVQDAMQSASLAAIHCGIPDIKDVIMESVFDRLYSVLLWLQDQEGSK